MAVANYHDQHKNLPPAYVPDAQGKPAHSWRMLLLPYLEQAHLQRRYDFDAPWNGPKNGTLAAAMPRLFAFHGDYREGRTTTTAYLAVVGQETVWPGAGTLTMDDVKDGASRTILIVENRGAGIHWMEPRDLEFARMPFTLNKPVGIGSRYEDPAVVLLDGTVLRLQPNLAPEVLKALLTRAGGEDLNRTDTGWEILPDGRDRKPAGS